MKFALLTIIWWVRVVSIHLFPKEADLQSAAFADSLLTHIKLGTTRFELVSPAVCS